MEITPDRLSSQKRSGELQGIVVMGATPDPEEEGDRHGRRGEVMALNDLGRSCSLIFPTGGGG
jgi:hypothetical protein